MKYGRGDWVRKAGLEESLEPSDADPAPDGAGHTELAADLEKLGPTFIKLGQLLSTRPDILPPDYIAALSRLQDDVEPFSFAEVERIVTEELGVRISKAFAAFESKPLAAASLGQVHRATLRGGTPVAVKVQRPAIRQQILNDLEAFLEIARLLDRHSDAGRLFGFEDLVDEFRRGILRELDYRQEARHLAALNQNLRRFRRIIVPAPVVDYTTRRVLTMEYIDGRKITAVSPLELVEVDGRALANELFRACLHQILIDGLFHADPHPGNVFLTGDCRIALLDLGMVARIPASMQEKLLRLVIAVAHGRGEEAAEAAVQIGEVRDGFDQSDFTHRVSDLIDQLRDAAVKDIQVGRLVLEVTRIAAKSGIRVPAQLALLGKALLSLDQVGRILDPDFDPNSAIRRYGVEMMRLRVRKSFSAGHLVAGVSEMKDFLERLPSRVNRILDRIADNNLEIRVDAIDEQGLMEGFQKVANRITLGLVLAALIVGAAMLMNVPTHFRLFGYPGLAIILFLAAAAGGFALVVVILFSDVKRPPRNHRP
ncbi:MAG: AarF/ABC1/UbiB kinase family protein [Acidobacteria bacterium]|nr:AarF/ABC1/UbiB kinase family protein [Acidobacteriota bacterium]